MSLFAELKRRNVIRVATAYVVAAWLVIQVVETIFPAFGFGDTAVRWVVIALTIGSLPALVVSALRSAFILSRMAWSRSFQDRSSSPVTAPSPPGPVTRTAEGTRTEARSAARNFSSAPRPANAAAA